MKFQKTWSAEDNTKLTHIASEHTVSELMEIFGRTDNAIRSRLAELGLKSKRKKRTVFNGPPGSKLWTEEERAFLKESAGKLSLKEMAAALGRSRAAVNTYGLKMKFWERTRTRERWTKSELFLLQDYATIMPPPLIARRMHRPLGSVKSMLGHMGVKTMTDCVSLRQAEQSTGYDRKQLARARSALGMKWRRAPGNFGMKRYLITSEQLDTLCDYLRDEPRYKKSVEDVFWERVEKREDGCWIWNGGESFQVKRDFEKHVDCLPIRYAWQLVHGPSGRRSFTRHCNSEKCINPEHHTLGGTRKPKVEQPHQQAA